MTDRPNLSSGCRAPGYGRIVEIQKADALRLYGPAAVWKDVRQRLLDDTCQVWPETMKTMGAGPRSSSHGASQESRHNIARQIDVGVHAASRGRGRRGFKLHEVTIGQAD